MNHLLLNLLADNVRPVLRGRRVGGIRLLPPVLSIEFSGADGPCFGVVILTSPGPFFYTDAADPIGGRGAEVLKRTRGLTVSGIEVPTLDRAIRIELAAAREESALSVWLFGSAAKVRVEGKDTIVEALDPRENGRPLPRRASGGVASGLRDSSGGPPGGTAALVNADAALLTGGLRPGAERRILGLSPELLDAFTAGGELDLTGLLRFRDGLLQGREPFRLATRRGAGSVCPVPLVLPAAMEPPTLAYGPFTRADEGCREVGTSIFHSLRGALAARWAAPLEKRLSARKRLLSALEEEQREAGASIALRHEAEILAAYRSRVPSGAAEAQLPDLYGSGERTIRLDPAVPLQEQINRRFRLAAKLERKRAVIGRRIGALRLEITDLEQDLAAAKDDSDLRAAIDRIDRAKLRHALDSLPRRGSRAKPQSRELRRFDVDAQWFVLVGRNDRENDEITFRIAGPDDIWLHAQHVAGSHVVLKSRGGTSSNPPRAALEAAAGIAAHYSKARRASVVPVIYTRRKYVRKFKGAKPGQVLCEREKTIFAEPSLPGPEERTGNAG
jgi:hypothetical protein